MKTVDGILCILCIMFLLAHSGCEPSGVSTEPTEKAAYVPVKVDILPLTELLYPDATDQQCRVKLYVSLLDSFGSQIKAPAVFRFELYEYVQRSAEPKGRRITLWPDTDLTGAAENNKYWRDFLRAYEFILPFEPTDDQSYILQATCFCPSGKRLSAEFTLRRTK